MKWRRYDEAAADAEVVRAAWATAADARAPAPDEAMVAEASEAPSALELLGAGALEQLSSAPSSAASAAAAADPRAAGTEAAAAAALEWGDKEEREQYMMLVEAKALRASQPGLSLRALADGRIPLSTLADYLKVRRLNKGGMFLSPPSPCLLPL